MLFIFNIILGTVRQVFLYTAKLPSVFTNYFRLAALQYFSG